MCLAIPGRIMSIQKDEDNGKDTDTAIIDYQGIRKPANISLIECKIGDWVLVHVGFAIQIIDEDSAKQTYNLLDEIDRKLNEQENNNVKGNVNE